MAEIKETIRDFLDFDIENEYYDNAKKEELVKMFKEILFEDDTTVRQFLKALFETTGTIAQQYSLVAPEGEVTEEIPTEEPIDEPEEQEDSNEPEELEDAEEMEDAEETEDAEELEDSIEESKKFYRNVASNILYD